MNTTTETKSAPTTVEEAEAALDELRGRDAELVERIEANEAERRKVALPAAEGDEGAAATIERLDVDKREVDRQRATLALAVEGAEERLQAAQAARAAKERKGKVAELNKLLGARLDEAAKAEARLKEAYAAVARMVDLGDQIRALHRDLAPDQYRRGEGARAVKTTPPLDFDYVSFRLVDYCYALGLGRAFRKHSMNGVTAHSESLVAGERDAQSHYHLSE